MLCVVVTEVEDGDFSHLKGLALNVLLRSSEKTSGCLSTVWCVAFSTRSGARFKAAK